MRQWVKWHTKVLTEPKVLRLSDRQFRVFANVIALAGYLDNEDGCLGPTEDVALHLRMSVAKAGEALADLCAAGIVIQKENVWFLKNWCEYNGKPPSDRKEAVRERVQRFRENQANTDDGNADVTPLQPERNEPREEKRREEVEKSREDNGAEKPAPPQPDPVAIPLTVGQTQFLQAFGAKRFKTLIQRETVGRLEKSYGTNRLKECVDWAAKRGMGLGEAVAAIEKAIPKWGEPKPVTASKGSTGMSNLERYVESQRAKS